MSKKKKKRNPKVHNLGTPGTLKKSDMSIEEMFASIDKRLNELYGEGCWHGDDLLDKHEKGESLLPQCLYNWLFYKRLPASDQFEATEPEPVFATYKGKRVKLNMGSRMGDIGISKDLKSETGYYVRVYIPELSDFSNIP